MKTLLFFLTCIGISYAFAQELKSFSGEMQDAILDNGKANYTYYEKDGEMVRHGKFTYSWKDQQTIQVRDKKINILLSKSISGNFKDGLKDGPWVYNVKYVDYPLNHSHGFNVSSDATYSTGSINMKANYKNGIPHGNWSYNQNYKTRYNIPVAYNSWKWSEISPVRTTSIKAQFNEGVLTGTFDYNNPFLKESAKFSLNDQGEMIGKGTYVNLGSTTEMIFKNGIRVKEIHRDMSSGEMKVKKDLTDILKDPNNEYVKITNDITGYLDKKMNYFRSDRYFNYRSIAGKKQLIAGDEFRFKEIKGGTFYDMVNCTSFDKSEATGYYRASAGHWLRNNASKFQDEYNYYASAEKYLNKKEYSKAIENYKKVQEILEKDDCGICSEDRKQYLEKVSNKIEEINRTVEEIEQKRKREKIEKKKILEQSKYKNITHLKDSIVDELIIGSEKQKVEILNFLYSKEVNNVMNTDQGGVINTGETDPTTGSWIKKYVSKYELIKLDLSKTSQNYELPSEWLDNIWVIELKYLIPFVKANRDIKKISTDENVSIDKFKSELAEIYERFSSSKVTYDTLKKEMLNEIVQSLDSYYYNHRLETLGEAIQKSFENQKSLIFTKLEGLNYAQIRNYFSSLLKDSKALQKKNLAELKPLDTTFNYLNNELNKNLKPILEKEILSTLNKLDQIQKNENSKSVGMEEYGLNFKGKVKYKNLEKLVTEFKKEMDNYLSKDLGASIRALKTINRNVDRIMEIEESELTSRDKNAKKMIKKSENLLDVWDYYTK